MKNNHKKIMIVDDSDIDREILRNILETDYTVIEEANGFSALEHIINSKMAIDAVMLDISMPIVDGFAVLEILKNNNVKSIPVIMITSEATKENVFKALQFGVTAFIGKPFDAEMILQKLRSLFNLPELQRSDIGYDEDEDEEHNDILSDRDIEKTNEYVDRLKNLFAESMHNKNVDISHYARVESLMNLIMKCYAADNPRKKLTTDHIKIISNAAYLYDIGLITLPDNCISGSCTGTDRDIYEDHTSAGAKIVCLNTSPAVQYFVDICSEMCMHHHERYDGTGFPHKLFGNDNNIYVSICSFVAEFDMLFNNRNIFDEQQFDFIVTDMSISKSKYDPEVLELFLKCKTAVIALYRKADIYIRH